MQFFLSDSQLAAMIGALVGGGIAISSQGMFYLLEARRQRQSATRAFVKQRLDDFYSPMLSRLLEIEYKLWLDLEIRSVKQVSEGETGDGSKSEKLLKLENYSHSALTADVAKLDEEILDLFRRKRWLAFESTIRYCQQLLRYNEAAKLTAAVGISDLVPEWADIKKLHDLHSDVRQHHDRLMRSLGIEHMDDVGTMPETTAEEKQAFDKYLTNILTR